MCASLVCSRLLAHRAHPRLWLPRWLRVAGDITQQDFVPLCVARAVERLLGVSGPPARCVCTQRVAVADPPRVAAVYGLRQLHRAAVAVLRLCNRAAEHSRPASTSSAAPLIRCSAAAILTAPLAFRVQSVPLPRVFDVERLYVGVLRILERMPTTATSLSYVTYCVGRRCRVRAWCSRDANLTACSLGRSLTAVSALHSTLKSSLRRGAHFPKLFSLLASSKVVCM